MVSDQAQRVPEDGAPGLGAIVRELQSGCDFESNARLLFDRCYRLVRRFFRHRGYPDAECEDLTQETFLRVYKGIGGFRHEARFETWVLRIAENVHRGSHVRQAADKRSGRETSLDAPHGVPEPASVESSAPGPLRRLLVAEQVGQLRRVLEDLPPQMRRCVSLRYFQQLQYREIAEVLEISVDAVKVQLFRARSRLRREMAMSWDGAEL